MLQTRHVRRNLLALGSDFVFFWFGFAFWDPTVVIPSFVKDLHGSDLLIGVLSAIRVFMITVPQLWAASFLVNQRRKKPLLVWASLGGRVPVLLLAVATLLWAGPRAPIVVGALALAVTLFYISEGLNGISWPVLVGKVIPARLRGRFLGVGQLLGSLGGLGSGLVVRLILAQPGLAIAQRWALIFACAFLGFTLSFVGIAGSREEPDDTPPSATDLRKGLRQLWGHLRDDARLRRVVGTQLLLSTAGAVFPFFVVRARELIPGATGLLGYFLALQSGGGMLAALVCGWLVDRLGSHMAIRLGTAVHVATMLAVLPAGLLGAAQTLYLVAFFLLGFIGSTTWWLFTAYLLDLATPQERPTYLAASGILSSPTFLNSILVGGLYGVVGAEALYAVALGIALLGSWLAWGLPSVRGAEHPATVGAPPATNP